MKAVCFAVMAGISVSACATVTKGTSDDVVFQSSPSGAMMTTSTGLNCTTPCQLRIKRNEPFTATFTLGRERRAIAVQSRFSQSGGAAMAGNVLAGGLIGVGVDAASGATKEHIPNPVFADFSKPQSEQMTASRFIAQKRADAGATVQTSNLGSSPTPVRVKRKSDRPVGY